MKKQLLAAAAAMVLSAGASAQGYGVVSAGVSRLSADCDGAAVCDKSDTAFKVLGGYKFSPILAAELGYFSFGKARFSDSGVDGKVTTSAFGGGVAYHQDLSSLWNFVARLGLAQVKTKIDASVSGLGSASDSDSNVQAYLGLGVGYKLSSAMSLDLSWDHSTSKYDKNGVSTSGSVNAYNVGLTFAF
jgi:OOP family OmpA-OmpF porin